MSNRRRLILGLLLGLLVLAVMIPIPLAYADPVVCANVWLIVNGETVPILSNFCLVPSDWTHQVGSGPVCGGTLDPTFKVCWHVYVNHPL